MAVAGVSAGSPSAAPRVCFGRADAAAGTSRNARGQALKLDRQSGLALTLLLIFPAGGAPASTNIPVDLKTCVEAADVIFAGTVTGMVAGTDGGTIITRVAFSDVVHVRGEPDSGDIVLNVGGGEVGNLRCVTVGAPHYEEGMRYVVLAKGDLGSWKNGFEPIVYFNQGLFTVKPERPGGPPVVHNGLPIAAYRDGHVVVVARPAPGDSAHGPGSSGASARRPSKPQDALDLKPVVEYGLRGQVVAEVLDSRADPGTRFSEELFLALLGEIGKSP